MSATTLSEAESKRLLARAGVTFAAERVVSSAGEAADAAREIGLPVVAKLNGDRIAHKTERGLVRLNLATPDAAASAAADLLAMAQPQDGEVSVLIARMVRGTREFIAGLATDEQFGKTVMLGVGGVLAEAVADVVFGIVPISSIDAHDMVDELASQALLGPFRGEPAVDRTALAAVIVALSELAESNPSVRSVDLNPLIIVDGRPIAVDALVEVER